MDAWGWGSKKGYKVFPLSSDGIDSTNLGGLMSYQGHRRWLDRNHVWLQATIKFNGRVELRYAPPIVSRHDLLIEIQRYEYPFVRNHPEYNKRVASNRLCWTDKSIFYELPY